VQPDRECIVGHYPAGPEKVLAREYPHSGSFVQDKSRKSRPGEVDDEVLSIETPSSNRAQVEVERRVFAHCFDLEL
jgi:hypothetical protein